MNEHTNDFDKSLTEYSQVNRNYRHFSNLRLMAFCFYFIIFFVGILFTFSEFRVGWTRGGIQDTTAKILWFIFTLTFLGIDVFCELNIRQLRLIAKELEQSLNFKQFADLISPKLAWIQYVIWGTYAVFLFFWVVAG